MGMSEGICTERSDQGKGRTQNEEAVFWFTHAFLVGGGLFLGGYYCGLKEEGREVESTRLQKLQIDLRFGTDDRPH